MNTDKVYIIAEMGINHNGSIENCFKMIDAAVDAGCNAAKFQFFRVKDLYPKSAGSLDWKDKTEEYSYNIYKAVKGFELPAAWICEMSRYCQGKGIDLLSSVFDRQGLGILMDKGFNRIKLASYVVTNIPLVEYCAKTGLPIIMSTGGATLGEVEEAVQTVTSYHKNLVLMHCSIQYPTLLSDCNLGVLKTLQLAFPEVKTGWSDHTAEVSDSAVQAVYLGAKVIEKHITLDKKMDGPDHFFALDPEELKRMVKDIRQAEQDLKAGNIHIDKTIYGNTAKIVYPHEQYLRDFAFMRLFAARDIRKGEIISASDISILRPGKKEHGLEPRYLRLFTGREIIAKKDIAFEDPLTWEAIL